jgi:5-methylcytosine-specific restriction endonuclease McrA
MKRCAECGQTKPTAEFYPRNDRPGQWGSYCKPCQYLRRKAWREANHERVRKTDRRWREANPTKAAEYAAAWRARNPEKAREWQRLHPEAGLAAARRWQLRHPEKARENSRKWAEAHREQAAAASRRWQANNPDKVIQIAKRRRARVRGAQGDATAAQIQARIDYYGGKCWMCGAPADTIDHVIALVRGGSHWPSNLRPACNSCNARKHTADHRRFLAIS